MIITDYLGLIFITSVLVIVAILLIADHFIRRGNAKDIENWKKQIE